MRAIRLRAALAASAALAVLAGCGGGGSGTGSAATSPEDQPGGAGDETPIATQALFTGKGGEITPATIRVPPFIAVKVVLHSADGAGYGIEVAHHELHVNGSTPTASLRLSGLRAGKRYTVAVTGAPETLAVVANAEPGP